MPVSLGYSPSDSVSDLSAEKSVSWVRKEDKGGAGNGFLKLSLMVGWGGRWEGRDLYFSSNCPFQ